MAIKRQVVVFRIGPEEFAMDIGLAREIVEMRPVTPVPETRDYVEGVMNLRGNLIPVLDLRKRLRAGDRLKGGSSGRMSEKRIIIVTLDGKQLGLIVDAASEVIRITDDMIEPPPEVIAEIGVEYIAGLLNVSGRFITMLDTAKALQGEVALELGEVMSLLASRAQASL
ncbi:MAG: chemotaxis protein CheW [Blastocatellia bacterium AA13]|nr:MAG: chemotaxis protein CheW [Blastocatellia bacterium AA13]